MIQYEDKRVELSAGDCHIVPRGVMHNPSCRDECLLALIEPVTTAHTGDTETEFTKTLAEQLAE
ncbi:MAG: hypothetical protein AAGC71_09235 [Pseudomonadota bacterium]